MKRISMPFWVVLALLLAGFFSILGFSHAALRGISATLFGLSIFGVAACCNKRLRELLKAFDKGEGFADVFWSEARVPLWLLAVLFVGSLNGIIVTAFVLSVGYVIFDTAGFMDDDEECPEDS